MIVGVDVYHGVEAHAWLPFEAKEGTSRFTELTGIPALREPGLPCDLGRFRK